MSDSTPTIRWTEAYSVNVATLDTQHQRLFVIINELNEALASGEGGAVIDSVLRRLVEYAQTHFATEEKLLADHKFPNLTGHRGGHDKFFQSIAKFREDFRAGKPGVPVSLMLFLRDWLKEHILVHDKAYTGFLNSRGVR